MIQIRPARPTDAGKVGAILTEFVEKTSWMPKVHTGAQDVAHAGTMIERGWVTVVEKNGDVVGFAACDDADLQALYVAGHARKCGLGTQLLISLQQEKDKLVLWTFQINAAAQRFYQRHGFAEMGRTDGADNDEQLPDVRYEWQRKAG